MYKHFYLGFSIHRVTLFAHVYTNSKHVYVDYMRLGQTMLEKNLAEMNLVLSEWNAWLLALL